MSGYHIIRQLENTLEEVEYSVCLENGVRICVRRDGSAFGSDGKQYYPLLKEYREDFFGCPDVMARVIGWSSELEREITLPLQK